MFTTVWACYFLLVNNQIVWEKKTKQTKPVLKQRTSRKIFIAKTITNVEISVQTFTEHNL